MTDITITAPSVGIIPPNAASQTIEPIALPYWGTSLSTACKGHVEARVRLIESKIWPDGVPSGLHVSVYNQMLAAGFTTRKWDVPSIRHLQRLRGGR
jgi:hypothetical protein